MKKQRSPSIRLITFGQLALLHSERKEALSLQQYQRVRPLLSCLLSSPGRTLSRSQVIELVWPNMDRHTASNCLDRAVYSLRRLLDPTNPQPTASTLLLTKHSVLELADQTRLWVDADAFEGALAQAQAVQEQDTGRAELLLGKALLLYTGDFLPGSSIALVQIRREALWRSWLNMMLELADLRIAREAISDAINILNRLVVADPTNEAAVQRLMILLVQAGQNNAAIRTYQDFVSLINQRYNMIPLSETYMIFENILRGIALIPLHQRA